MRAVPQSLAIPIIIKLVTLHPQFASITLSSMEALTASLCGFASAPELQTIKQELTAIRRAEDIFDVRSDRHASGQFLEAWTQACIKSAELARESPMAATVVSLRAMLVWECSFIGSGGVFALHGGRQHAGWAVFPKFTARNLIRLGALPAARWLLRISAEVIAADRHDRRLALADEYRAVQRVLERESNKKFDEMASELAYAQTKNPDVQILIALLALALGDVPTFYSSVQRDILYTFPMYKLKWIVITGLAQKADAPIVTEIFHRLFALNAFSSDAHGDLSFELNISWHKFGLDPSDSANQTSDVRIGISALDNAIAYLNNRSLAPTAEIDRYLTRGMHHELSNGLHFVQVLGLRSCAGPNSGTQFTTIDWMANLGEFLRSSSFERKVLSASEHLLEIPFLHMKATTADELAYNLNCLEIYRVAGQDFWLRIVSPDRTDVPLHLITREDGLLALYRGSVFANLDLPLAYRTFILTYDPSLSEQEKVEGFFSRDWYAELREIHQQFGALNVELREFSPAYGNQRSQPAIDVTQFIGCLRPAAHHHA